MSRPMAQYVWDLPNKSGWVHAKLCHYQGLTLPEKEHGGKDSTWAR